jgi:hypothetical protein
MSLGRLRRQAGQASVELLAAVPALVLLLALAAALALAGWSLWSAEGAARAGARAEAVGSDPGRAARSALPSVLRSGAAIERGAALRVRVQAPGLPGAPPVEAWGGGRLPGAGDAVR